MRKSILRRHSEEMLRHENTCAALVEERIDDFSREWKRTRKTPISLIFGMGTMAADGVDSDKYLGGGWPKILDQLEQDLDVLTDQFRTACPENRTIG